MTATATPRQNKRQFSKSASVLGPPHMQSFNDIQELLFFIAELLTMQVRVERLSGLTTAKVVM